MTLSYWKPPAVRRWRRGRGWARRKQNVNTYSLAAVGVGLRMCGLDLALAAGPAVFLKSASAHAATWRAYKEGGGTLLRRTQL